jgi:SHS2 domain-containing protein
MPYRYLEDIAIADVAFEAEGKTAQELFQSAAAAMTNTMINDLGTIGRGVVRSFDLEAQGMEMLLYRFLQELIFYKDAERLLFSSYELAIETGVPVCRMHVRARGEEIDREKQALLSDVKAVSLHRFSIRKTADGWKASVIIDV